MKSHANHRASGRLHCDHAGTLSRILPALASLAVASICIAQTPDASGWAEPRVLAVADSEQSEPNPLAQCAACHGADGNSKDPQFPKLAGQDPNYLFAQLWAFRSGARPSEVMTGIAANLSESDAASAASFYAQQVVRPDVVKSKALAAAGERVFFGGGSSGMVPACAMCHGAPGQRGMHMGMMGGMGMMGMGGMMSNAPKLNGQRAAYIVDQLDRFADGRRQAMVMNRIAFGLTDREKKAVAEFVSGLP